MMKKIFLSVCLFIACHLARAQWTTSAPNIYYNSGNVGIGTTAPGFNLDMASNLNSYIQLRMTNTNAGSTAGVGIQMTSQNGSSYLLRTSNNNAASWLSNTTILQDNGGGDIVMYGGTEVARFTNGGNVCIGTTTGVEKLTISGNALADKFRLNNVSTPGVGCGIFAPAASTVAVYSSALERMRVAANGNVLIGKTSQTNTGYILDVNGSARANSVVVNTTGADYVFGKDYKLSPLTKLEKFINEHHHLPGIAPEAEMQKNGVDLGDNQTRMLAKIEELTLYVIEQSKQQEKLVKEVKALQEENRRLHHHSDTKKLHQ